MPCWDCRARARSVSAQRRPRLDATHHSGAADLAGTRNAFSHSSLYLQVFEVDGERETTSKLGGIKAMEQLTWQETLELDLGQGAPSELHVRFPLGFPDLHNRS